MPRVKQTSTEERYPLRMEASLKLAVEEMARREGTTIRSVIEEALRAHIQCDTALRTDADLAPLIDRVLTDRHRQLGDSLRTLTMRLVLEVMRMQYTLNTFMEKAGVPPDDIRKWREDGWPWGYREFRRQPRMPSDDLGR